jgi:hypothetical protein
MVNREDVAESFTFSDLFSFQAMVVTVAVKVKLSL